MLPFPDDYYTVADPTSHTGRRVHFSDEAMPANAEGEHIEAGPYNASDGFSPGSVILVKVPGINTAADVRANRAVPINHIGQYTQEQRPGGRDRRRNRRTLADLGRDRLQRPQPGRRGPRDPPGRQLHLRAPLHRGPAQPQERCPRIARSARRLPLLPRRRPQRTGSGQRTPSPLRRTLLEARRGGIQRSSLYLAWDFTVASDANNTERELDMRNDAFAQLGDTNLADGIPQGVSPTLPRHERRKRTVPGRNREARERHLRRSLLPVPVLRNRWADGARRRRRADTGRHLDGQLRVHHPRLGDHRSRPNRAARRCTGTGCWATRKRLPPAPSGACRRTTRSSTAPPTRSGWPNRTSPR